MDLNLTVNLVKGCSIRFGRRQIRRDYKLRVRRLMQQTHKRIRMPIQPGGKLIQKNVGKVIRLQGNDTKSNVV